MTTHTCIIDLETFSSVDIKSAGAWRYIDSPDFEILLLAYAVDDNPTQVIDMASGETPPGWLINALHDPAYIKHAFNAAFEFAALSKVYGMMQPEQWRCSMVHALYCGYPGSLEGAGTAIGLPQEKQKMTVGKALIRYFCCPVKPTKSNGGRTRNFPHHDPEKWALFKEYNRQDVDAEREIDRRLASFPLPPDVQKQWETDLRINRRGVHVDQEMVDGALAIGAGETAALTARARTISGLDNPNSGQQLLGWLHSRGAGLPDLQKATVSDALASGKLPDIETTEMLTIRQDLGKTSNKKYEALETCVCADGRVRGLLQFYGANRTGRWAGRLVQVQNLPRTYIEQLDLARRLVKERKADSLRVCFGSVQDTLSQLIRTTLTAEPGKVLIDADFSAIEARVIAWLAGEEWRLEAFRNGKDIYCESASRIFGVPVEKHGVNGHLRAKGKVAELACIAEGQPVMTNRGLVPIEKVTASDLLWDGESWVQHDGVIFKGERDVITYEGLIATPDHLVWVEGKPEPVRFGFASASGAHLVQSADSGKAIRVGTDHRGREESGSREAQMLAQNSRKTRVYDIRNAGRHNRFTVSGKLVHNCGYGGSVGAMRNMGGSDLDMTDDELQQIVNDWRAASPKIVKLWYDLQDAAISAINGAAKKTHGMTFRRETDLVSGHAYLTIQLPSGRKLFYLEPQIGENRWGGASITYLGVNQETKKWERIETYSGKIAENCTQSVARDCLALAIENVEAAGLPVVFHVHDEVVIETLPFGSEDEMLHRVTELMTRPIAWAPGLPLKAEGWVGRYFKKD